MTALNPFIEHPAERAEVLGGVEWLFRFPNGYGASVVQHEYSYGSAEGLWELAAIGSDGETDISDVIGHCTEGDIRELLRRIAELPAAPQESALGPFTTIGIVARLKAEGITHI